MSSLAYFKNLALKYHVTTSGSIKAIAQRLALLRGKYLSKAQIQKIYPYLANNKNKKNIVKIYEQKGGVKSKLTQLKRKRMTK